MVESTGSHSDLMFCHNCGTAISRNSAFCTWCGIAMLSSSAVASQTEPIAQQSSPPVIPQSVAPPPVMPPAYAQSTYAAPYPQTVTAPAPRGHSGVGVASFVIACVAFITLLATSVSCVANIDVDFETIEESVGAVIGLLFLLSIGLLLIGVSTGIIGVVQSNRKKLFAILGLIFNLLMLLPIVAVLILGFSINS